MSDSFLPLTPQVFHILLALAAEDRHGYALMVEVEAMTQGAVRLGPGTLYGALKRLCEEGLIRERPRRADADSEDTRRRYYALTELGHRVLAAETARLTRMVSLAHATGVRPAVHPA